MKTLVSNCSGNWKTIKWIKKRAIKVEIGKHFWISNDITIHYLIDKNIFSHFSVLRNTTRWKKDIFMIGEWKCLLFRLFNDIFIVKVWGVKRLDLFYTVIFILTEIFLMRIFYDILKIFARTDGDVDDDDNVDDKFYSWLCIKFILTKFVSCLFINLRAEGFDLQKPDSAFTSRMYLGHQFEFSNSSYLSFKGIIIQVGCRSLIPFSFK